MITVSLDAMGGDNAPEAPVRGAVDAVNESQDLHIMLVGDKTTLTELLSNEEYSEGQISIAHADQVITSTDDPTKAVKRKQESSLVKAMTMVKEGDVKAVVSAGNTGAFMAGGLLILGRISGISRPALAPILPTFRGGGTVLLDVGATMDAKPENLLDFAMMGSVYAEKVLGRSNPELGLINVGEEGEKGNQLTKQAYQLINNSDLNFIGNLEGREIMSGLVDVAVCEGFLGNVLLKFTEGLGKNMFGEMKQEFTSTTRAKLGALLLKPKLQSFKDKFDYSEYGGAPFLGISGVCIKSHGSSDGRAIKNALLKQAKVFIEEDVLFTFKRQVTALKS